MCAFLKTWNPHENHVSKPIYIEEAASMKVWSKCLKQGKVIDNHSYATYFQCCFFQIQKKKTRSTVSKAAASQWPKTIRSSEIENLITFLLHLKATGQLEH